MNDAAKFLKERTSDAGGSALELLTKALSKSLYSERLLQMKADALYLVFSNLVLCSLHLNVLSNFFCYCCCFVKTICIIWLIIVAVYLW